MSYSNNFTFYYDLTHHDSLYNEVKRLYNYDGYSFLASPITVEETPEIFKIHEKIKRTTSTLKKKSENYKNLLDLFNGINIVVDNVMLSKMIMKKMQVNGISFTRSKPNPCRNSKMLKVNFTYEIQIDEKFTPETYKVEVGKIYEEGRLALQKVDAKEESFEFMKHTSNSMLKIFPIMFELKRIHNKINDNLISDNLQDIMNSISEMCEEFVYYNMCWDNMLIPLKGKKDKFLNKLDKSFTSFNIACNINIDFTPKDRFIMTSL